jgi:hypothetical protein
MWRREILRRLLWKGDREELTTDEVIEKLEAARECLSEVCSVCGSTCSVSIGGVQLSF